jgi:hypothetical protein
VLVDVPKEFEFLDSIAPDRKDEVRRWRAERNPYWQLPERIAPGLYWDPYRLFENYANTLVTDPFDMYQFPGDLADRMAELSRRSAIGWPLENYGVCDSPEQVVRRWEFLATAPERYLVAFVKIERVPGERTGWRWRKNGPYIGDHTPEWEYLDDEPPTIGHVLLFHIYQVIE